MLEVRQLEIHDKPKKLYRFIGLIGLVGLIYAFSIGNFGLAIMMVAIPFSLILLKYILDKPITLLYVIFFVNYFIMAGGRYVDIGGISVLIDTLLIGELVVIFIHTALLQKIEWKYAINPLTIATFVWAIYCVLEVVNPSGMFEAWYRSRHLIYSGFVVALIPALVIVNSKQVRIIIVLYSIFTLLAIAKAIMQKYIGFDAGEARWLRNGGDLTHVLITGTRYFSFFTDAGNFGSNMGCSGAIFLLLSYFSKKIPVKLYYFAVGALSIYAMFLSGTRGAMIVPLGALLLYTLTSKNFVTFGFSSIMLVGIYVFFAFTNIGESNSMIRRMRTSFHPSEDASFNVRKINQAALGRYLKNKPFGEGLGLSGVENQDLSYRFTTQVPNDSWYVKIWVETGIVGLIIYLGGFIIVLMNCVYIVMFKIKSKEMQGICTSLLCGVFGLLLSAYGNPFFGQFPTMIIALTFLAICLKSPYIHYDNNESENALLDNNENKKIL